MDTPEQPKLYLHPDTAKALGVEDDPRVVLVANIPTQADWQKDEDSTYKLLGGVMACALLGLVALAFLAIKALPALS